MNDNFGFQQLVDLCRLTHEEMQSRASRSVDAFLVVRNWLFGWCIVEYEQKGADRAEYGSQFMEKLSGQLKQAGIRGSSPTRLKLYRAFYKQFKQIRPTVSGELEGKESGKEVLPWIRPTVSDESLPSTNATQVIAQELVEQLLTRFPLGWSHYVALLTIDKPEERRFYEIEAAANNWGVRELERQIASSLYERLALSRNKEEIRRLSKEGQVLEKAADIIKNPLVLEFLGFEEKPSYSEEELKAQLEKIEAELGGGE